MRDRIILNPMLMQPPASDKEMTSLPLAYLMEGSFNSYFTGKPTPQPEKGAPDTEAKGEETSPSTAPAKLDLSNISGKGDFKGESPAAKIFVIASSEMISDQLLDPAGKSANAMFVLNMIDALNNRSAIGTMRSKAQQYNPIKETGAVTRTVIKSANIIGLPIAVILAGLVVWYRRYNRKKKIKITYQGNV